MKIKRKKGQAQLANKLDWLGEHSAVVEDLKLWKAEVKRRFPHARIEAQPIYRAYDTDGVKLATFGTFPGKGIIVGRNGKNMYGTKGNEKRWDG